MPEWLTEILDWIRLHPGWAGLTIAVVAFLEGLALVGILIPGIVILFGFGALVGLGVLDLATVWLWCSVGAILGDAVSFWLGYHFKSHIRDIWPFNRFTDLITRGENFFRRHGTKSVVIGRFVGPIRPIMPVVAGMMNMSLKRYVPANVIAGAAWAPAYLLPGVVFGASIELAKAVALRLALLICLIAVSVWLISAVVGGAYRYLAPRGSRMLAYAMAWSRRHPVLGRVAQPLVDPNRPESGSLALFALLLIAAAWGLISLMIAVPLADGPLGIDLAVSNVMADLRTPWADSVMVYMNGLGSVFVLGPASAAVLAWLLWRRRTLAAWHWGGAVGVGFVLATVIGYLLDISRGQTASGVDPVPNLHVAMGVVVYGFFAVLITRELPYRRRVWPYVVATALVTLISFARLYFAAHWLSDMIAGAAFGLLWVTIIGIAYRRRIRRSFWGVPVSAVFFLVVGASVVLYGLRYSQQLIDEYAVPVKSSVVDAESWWQKGLALKGSEDGLLDLDQRPLNVQYAGSLEALVEALEDDGWVIPPKAEWTTALAMLQPEPSAESLPILPSGYGGRAEALLLAKADVPSDTSQLVLHLWPSSTRLNNGQPVWLGQVAWQEIDTVLYFFSYWDYAINNQDPVEVLLEASDPTLDTHWVSNGLLIRLRG